MGFLLSVLCLLLLAPTAAPAARPTIRAFMAGIQPGMRLTDVQARFGPPNSTHIIFDANDRVEWYYDASDGRAELTVAPREGTVKVVEARLSLAAVRECIRIGETTARCRARIAARTGASSNRQNLLTCFGGSAGNACTHEYWATDGTLDVWADRRTDRIRRVVEDRHLVTGRRVP